TYYVVHPNGFTPADGGRFIAADEGTQLGGWAPVFSLLLPLELWALIAVLALPAAIVVVVLPRSRLRKVLQVVLVVPAALWAARLCVGVLQFLATTADRYSWVFQAVLILLGSCVVAPYAVLTVWLCVTAWRQPTGGAQRQGAVAGAPISTGAAEQD